MKRFKKVMRVAGWLGFALVAVGLLVLRPFLRSRKTNTANAR